MLNRCLEAIVSLFMALTVAIAFAGVIARYVLGQSLGWSYEALQALLVAMTFASAYLALRRGAHLKIDVLVQKLPLGAQAPLFVFNQLVIAAVGLVMLVYGTEQALRFWSRESLVLELPLGPLYGLIPLSGLGIALEALSRIPGGLRRARAGQPPETPDAAYSLEERG